MTATRHEAISHVQCTDMLCFYNVIQDIFLKKTKPVLSVNWVCYELYFHNRAILILYIY